MAGSWEYEYFKVSFPAEYVAHIEIDRPQKLNAFIEQMWLNLRKIFDRMSHDPSIRAILFSGNGRAFTAGLDVQAASSSTSMRPEVDDVARRATALRRHILEFQDCISSAERCEKPVITMMHGICYGMAIDLATATDIRLAVSETAKNGEAAKLCIKEIDIGLAADVGTLNRLPKVVGNFSWIKEACLTARVFGAEEAERVGLISRVVASKEEGIREGLRLAGEIAKRSPVAAVGTKALLNYSRDSTVEDSLRYTAAWNASMLQTKDMQDALTAGLERRKATFEKL